MLISKLIGCREITLKLTEYIEGNKLFYDKIEIYEVGLLNKRSQIMWEFFDRTKVKFHQEVLIWNRINDTLGRAMSF